MPKKKAATRYFPFPDDLRAKYFAPLISNHRNDLAEAKFVLLFREGRWSSKNRETWATVKKLTAETKAMLQDAYSGKYGLKDNTPAPDFVITVNYEVWNSFDETARYALLHHELCHCEKDIDKDGNPKYSLIGHDLEEFTGIVRKYGNWSYDCRRMFEAMQNGGQQVLEFKPKEGPGEGLDEEAV
jgi:hypothetical protein